MKNNIEEKFDKELNEWLESDEHRYNCAACSEGQRCCLDEFDDKELLFKANGRKFIKELIRKYYEK